MARFEGFTGRVRANLLLERALKFGVECHGVHLHSTISHDVRRLVREHLAKPGVPATKEEIFFALIVAVLPSLDPETLLALYQDARCYELSHDVEHHFFAAVDLLGPDQRVEIDRYRSWLRSRADE